MPRADGEIDSISISSGDVLFVLGANGTGKSSLLQHIYRENFENARRIAAHRQTWLMTGNQTLSPDQKRRIQSTVLNNDKAPESRWIDRHSGERPSISIYDLVNSQNTKDRMIASAVREGDLDLANRLAEEKAPIAAINELLQISNLPIIISLVENEQLLARKFGGAPYSIAELSDGERNAILLAADVLTVGPDTLVVIDEPERHLHRSIISPLLTALFAKRPDCAFVISTHEVMLPVDNPDAQTLLLRDCAHDLKSISTWQADLVSARADFGEDIRKDILGARRRILFVEGDEASLDKALYAILFPDVSVIAKASSRDVDQVVSGIRNAEDLHWVRAFGLIDNDGRDSEQIEQLRSRGIYALTSYSVESLYYHPEVQAKAAKKLAELTGEDAEARIMEAKEAALAAIKPHVDRISKRTAERTLRQQVLRGIPTQEEIEAGDQIEIKLDVSGSVASERARIEKAIEESDLTMLIGRYPVRETSMLTELVKKLGFKNRDQYEKAVRTLLVDDEETLELVRSLTGTLANDLKAA